MSTGIRPGDYVAYTDDHGIERTARAVDGSDTVAGEPVVWIIRRTRGRREVAALAAHLVRPLPIVKPEPKTAGAAA